MKVRDLAYGLKHLGENEGVEECAIVAIAKNGATFSIRGFRPERHEDGDGSTTVWLDIEEN